tara:strand:+ start:510 stop:863 length:354 start_codon:yes stop_codon:yes gene_type:complete
MASTRDRNLSGNYEMEKRGKEKQINHYVNDVYARPVNVYMPGDGLLAAKTCRNELSTNACDIESMLRGIGANNMENPKPETMPQIKELRELRIMNKPTFFVQEPVLQYDNQRPIILN